MTRTHGDNPTISDVGHGAGERRDAPLRDAREPDFADILRLNAESVHFLSALDPDRLQWLHGMAAYHRVVQVGERVEAFLIAFREGSAYDSPNYRWFAARHVRFVYIDRIVIGSALRGQGTGTRMYGDLLRFARDAGVGTIACEIDSDPPNEVSRRFHEGFGFAEVGSQRVGEKQKLVSLQVKEVPMKIAAVRQHALSLPETVEAPHHHFSSFRVRGKIFVTVPPDELHVHVFVGEEDRERALALYPATIEKLLWGSKVLGVRIALPAASARVVKELVSAAWRNKAPAALLR